MMDLLISQIFYCGHIVAEANGDNTWELKIWKIF
jgi:hypothetical protein